MATQNTTLYNPLNDNGLMNFFKELQADKDLNSLNIDLLANTNKVLPAGYQQFLYLFGETFGKLRETGALKKFFELALKYSDSIIKLYNKRPVIELHPLRGGAKFLVCDHANLFFHGTPVENYEKILETGYLKLSDYSVTTDKNEIDNALRDFFMLEKGYAFLSDDFKVSARYAIRHSAKGVVFGFDLYGFWLEHLHDRIEREFVSQKEIPLDCLKKAYLVEVIDNQIQVKEMEAVR